MFIILVVVLFVCFIVLGLVVIGFFVEGIGCVFGVGFMLVIVWDVVKWFVIVGFVVVIIVIFYYVMLNVR